ncbi:MAG: hypothetical protein EHM34_02350, partial [Nitrosopumilales archaeon]
MERIDRKYAIIYVDRTGETLTKPDYVTEDIVSDYYSSNNAGFLQWNFYLIIAKNVVNPDDIKIIENNDLYCRKYVIADNKIKSFIDEWFPIMQDERGSITLVKGDSHVEAEDLAWRTFYKTKSNSNYPYMSWYRDYNLMYSLTKMDKLRATLINNPDINVVFGTHISNEYSLAEKKFKL